MYKLSDQLKVGAKAELRVAEWLRSQGLCVIQSNREEDIVGGVDLLVSDTGEDDTKRPTSIDVKSDELAFRTGNFFIEIMSELEAGKVGWLYKSKCAWVFYCIPQTGDIYMIRKKDLKNAMFTKWKTLPWKTVQNHNYHSVGVPVPVKEVSKIAAKKVRIQPWQ